MAHLGCRRLSAEPRPNASPTERGPKSDRLASLVRLAAAPRPSGTLCLRSSVLNDWGKTTGARNHWRTQTGVGTYENEGW